VSPEKETPQFKTLKAITDRTSKSRSPIPQVKHRLSIEDRPAYNETPYLARQKGVGKSRSRTPVDKEHIPGPSRAQFNAAALPAKHVLNALAHHDVNQLARAASIARALETEQPKKMQRISSKESRRPRSQRVTRKIKA
jgi:hypothetical protein